MERPSFTFRLERVRSLRTRAEEQAREALAQELQLRLRGEAALRAAAEQAEQARALTLATATRGTTGHGLLAAQAWMQRTELQRQTAALDLDRRDAEVAARRDLLAAAARDKQAIDKLAERQQAAFDAEWALREQHALDEMAMGMHRREVAA